MIWKVLTLTNMFIIFVLWNRCDKLQKLAIMTGTIVCKLLGKNIYEGVQDGESE